MLEAFFVIFVEILFTSQQQSINQSHIHETEHKLEQSKEAIIQMFIHPCP